MLSEQNVLIRQCADLTRGTAEQSAAKICYSTLKKQLLPSSASVNNENLSQKKHKINIYNISK